MPLRTFAEETLKGQWYRAMQKFVVKLHLVRDNLGHTCYNLGKRTLTLTTISGNTLFVQIWISILLKLKFGTETNSNMQKSVMILIFFILDHILGKLDPKYQYCQLNLKFGT